MAHAQNKELELKFEMDVGELKALQMTAAQCDDLHGEPKVQQLRSIYFDTPTFALRAAGIALRARLVDGQWVQTVKAKTVVKGGVSNPIESENPLDNSTPVPALIGDKVLRKQVLRIVEEALLLPVFETVVERTSYRLMSVRGGDVELAVDVGHVFSDKGLIPIGEAELELKAGGPEVLLHFASVLFAGRHFKLASQNKASRGFVLIGAEKPPHLLPVALSLPSISESQTIHQAFVQLIDASVDFILHNWAVTQSCNDPEGPHQLRVGLRLFRSLLRAFRPSIDNPALREMEKRARYVTHLVGRLRDLDVLIDDIYAPVALKEGGKNQLDERRLADRLTRYRDVVRSQTLEEMQHWPCASFQIELALFTRMAPWDTNNTGSDRAEPIPALAKLALKKSYRHCQRWGADIDKLDFSERHSMRKSLKIVRYQAEIFGPLYGRRKTRRFCKKLRALQDVFGYLNDVAMASHLSKVVRDAGPASPTDKKIADKVIARHEKQAQKTWKKAKRRWEKLDDTRPFWS
ncbi:CYTH and CHAD domain-containing protein [Cohaesibacter celericrescens]|uniref:CYTH and CHAD domain-containing protein n=1 Tax=Cohaesibacter celericrescens TaxID=2067669 RepID=UPI00356A651B